MTNDKVKVSHTRMRRDVTHRWTAAAQKNPDFLQTLVVATVVRMSDEELEQAWDDAFGSKETNHD